MGSSWEMILGKYICYIFLRHLLMNTCRLLVISGVTFQVSHPQNKIVLTFVWRCEAWSMLRCLLPFISDIITCKPRVFALRIRALISATAPPSRVTKLPRYVNSATSSMLSSLTFNPLQLFILIYLWHLSRWHWFLIDRFCVVLEITQLLLHHTKKLILNSSILLILNAKIRKFSFDISDNYMTMSWQVKFASWHDNDDHQ